MTIPINKNVWSIILFISLKKYWNTRMVRLKNASMHHCHRVMANITPSSLKDNIHRKIKQISEVLRNICSLPFSFFKKRFREVLLHWFSLSFHTHHNPSQEEYLKHITTDNDSYSNWRVTGIFSQTIFDYAVLASTPWNSTRNEVVEFKVDFIAPFAVIGDWIAFWVSWNQEKGTIPKGK